MLFANVLEQVLAEDGNDEQTGGMSSNEEDHLDCELGFYTNESHAWQIPTLEWVMISVSYVSMLLGFNLELTVTTMH